MSEKSAVSDRYWRLYRGSAHKRTDFSLSAPIDRKLTARFGKRVQVGTGEAHKQAIEIFLNSAIDRLAEAALHFGFVNKTRHPIEKEGRPRASIHDP